jgi:hypothetical protein
MKEISMYVYLPHPRRVQQQRACGWRKPDGARSVVRPGPFGNPFLIEDALRYGRTDSKVKARALVVDAFTEWLDTGECAWPVDGAKPRRERLLDRLPELAEASALMCFCDLDGPCHADVLGYRVDALSEPEREQLVLPEGADVERWMTDTEADTRSARLLLAWGNDLAARFEAGDPALLPGGVLEDWSERFAKEGAALEAWGERRGLVPVDSAD